MSALSPLHPYLIRWERRWRLQRLLGWLPYALVLMAAVGGVGVLLAWLIGTPPLDGAALGVLIAAAIASGWLLRQALRPLPRAARYFERTWALQERLSTALEVASGRIPTSPLTERLMADAVRAAEKIDPRAALPLPLDGRGWLLAGLVWLILIGLLLVPPPPREASPALNPVARAAAQEATEALAQVIAELSQDTTLTPAMREGLLATLEARLEALKEGTLSAEAAFAALSEAQNALDSAAQAMADQAQAQADALSAAAQAFSTQPLSSVGGEARSQSLSEALRAQLESAAHADPSAARQQQQAAQQAADAVRQQFPELAATLDQAANADAPDALRAALEQAAQQAQQAAQQQQRQQQAADAMQQRADSAQQQAQALAQSEASASQPDAAASRPEEANQQAETGLPQAGQQEAGQGAEGETSQAEAGAGEQAQSQPGGQTGQDSSDSQAGDSGEGRSDSSAASDAASEQEASGSAAGSRQCSPGDGEGEANAAVIFTGDPARVFGAEPVILPGDPGSAPARPADTVSLPEAGQSVPFRQLLDRYVQQAGRSLEADVVPSGLADFIRSYFTELSR